MLIELCKTFYQDIDVLKSLFLLPFLDTIRKNVVIDRLVKQEYNLYFYQNEKGTLKKIFLLEIKIL